MRKITNFSDNTDIKDLRKRVHNIKISSNQLVRLAEESKIPIFIAYYDPEKGYQYNGLFPEEIDSPDVDSEWYKFYEFLKVCISFNKADLIPQLSKKKKK